MRRLSLLLVLGCVQCGPIPAHALQWVDGAVVLAPMEQAQVVSLCSAAEQCVITTRTALMRFQAAVQQAAVDAAAEVAIEQIERAKATCRRNSL